MRIEKSALVPWSPRQMYELVADVEAYPQFLPWCRGATVLSRDGNSVTARLALAKGGLRHSFTTRNTMQEGRRIDMHLVEGPFRSLHGCWTFEERGSGCLVSLDMNFALASRVLSLTLGPAFQKIAATLVEAFVERAKALHGRP